MADEKQYLIDIDLAAQGGKIRLKDIDHFDDWIARESSAWEWLTSKGDGGPPGNISTHLGNLFSNLRGISSRIRNGQINEHQANSQVLSLFAGETPQHFYSQGEAGQAIFAIREELGADSAALTYSLLGGVINFNLRVPRHFELLTYVANPSLMSGEARRKASRASYRSLLTELQDLAQEQHDKLAEFDKSVESGIAAATETAKERFRRGLRYYAKARQRGWKRTKAAIKSVQDTEQAYTDYMRLRSAVNYWEAKRDEHSKEEYERSKVLLDFVNNSAICGLILFLILFLVMLEMSGVNSLPFVDLTPNGNDPLPGTPFMVIIASLGTVITGLIWAARIMVRNYQTERHLKIDAEERRIMTMTYLALINEGSAIADEDRLIILNALFRQASDGAPKDESPQEVALPALIARLVDRR